MEATILKTIEPHARRSTYETCSVLLQIRGCNLDPSIGSQQGSSDFARALLSIISLFYAKIRMRHRTMIHVTFWTLLLPSRMPQVDSNKFLQMLVFHLEV